MPKKNPPKRGGNGLRPDFAPGNALAAKHGARSPRVYSEVAATLAAELLADRPDLEEFPEAVAAWATAEAQAALMRRHVAMTGGPIGPDGEPREGLLQWLTKFERLAAETRRPIGLDPTSSARLARERATVATLAVNLAGIASAGAVYLEEVPDDAPVLPSPDVAGDALEAVTGPSRARYVADWAALNAGATTAPAGPLWAATAPVGAPTEEGTK